MFLKFKPYIKIFLNEEMKEVILHRPLLDGDVGQTYELSQLGINIIKLLIDGIAKEKLITSLNLHTQTEIDELNDILELLINERYVGKEFESVPLEYKELDEVYGRLIPMWGELESEGVNRFQIQKSVMNKKVGIIGCGTIGMGIISKLITVGINKFVLVDHDVVSRTNLTRQSAFTLKDIGKPKVDVAKKFIMDRIEQPIIDTYCKQIRKPKDLLGFEDVNMIVVASDDLEADKIIQAFGNKYRIPLSFPGGYMGATGKIFSIVIPGLTHDYNCMMNSLDNKVNEYKMYKSINSISGFTLSSFASVADFISSISSFEIIKYFTGEMQPYLINKVLHFNFRNYTIDEIEIDNRSCSCFEKQPV